MNVIVKGAGDHAAAVEIDLDRGGPFLVIYVNQPYPPGKRQRNPGDHFKRTFRALIRDTGPRGGDRGTELIGYTEFDVRMRNGGSQ